ncbi:hypothetical protein GQ600_16418 [Phytophthora cactorum]|nr:hypothetical protein GQ600_16418 [Phytophthora cactorum]
MYNIKEHLQAVINFEEVAGTYCSIDDTLYGLVNGLGTFDMNGSSLAQDTGSVDYRWSYCGLCIEDLC